ncbi:Peptidoglycan/xylan/chitin deacetylase, PgdA/CDA1 family [Andreprevotia lacus DSM 23236]|jgi:peptidoglycan/xylan/chitin deacetylase (PgdA/CDA1 family)|uniref:Peptidoglycan/xylan/chitin deacetylase, PgdA/CDA1 family n=1 Tax=Andreprevotia lacus DSM 23236 TaxID=1121001 RepID=A0A1W1XPW9_9NEIS|nr:polysaccharide deacetylase family protein [Andreprevotia lacus]SMC25892.1 Peptidoglycan/xylan/chitin deacetylase, PgdA/CDA1 family [Andreprevotia lacus DSM 23236]
MRLLALKIDIDTYRGTREGVPRLVEALKRHNANATFLWSLGADHTGRAIKRAFRPGFMKKVSRTSVLEHYGLKTLMYGTLLPGPDIGKRCAATMREVAAQGFENGIHTWDHVRWQDGVAQADAPWTEAEMNAAVERYKTVFGEPPHTHGAAGWQMNAHAYRHEQRLGLTYASDGRGTHPFWPVINGELVRVPQLPTTLPTLDELIGVDGLDVHNVDAYLLKLTESALPTGHVYTLHAELEGMKLLPVFERLLAGWTEQGYKLVSTGELLDTLDLQNLPYHHVEMGEVPGRSGTLALQGALFP